MKFVVFVALGVATLAIATPSVSRLRRQSSSGCSDRTNLSDVLQEVGNLLSNLLANLPLVNSLNLTGSDGLIDLTGLLTALGDVLTDLLGTGLNTTTEPLVKALTGLISNLNQMLGGKKGSQWACKSSNGTTSGDIGSLVSTIHLADLSKVLRDVVTLLMSLLIAILRGLGVPVPNNYKIPSMPQMG